MTLKREEAQISLDEMAARVGVSKATISRIERYLQSPRLTLVARIKNELDVTADDFLPRRNGKRSK